MQLRGILPWNWGSRNVPVHREARRDVEVDAPFGSSHPAFSRFFDEFFAGRGLPGFEAFDLEPGEGFMPALDASETDSEYTISVELPGMDEKDIDISLSDDAVTIRGKKSEESERDDNGSHWIERRYGSFKRVVPLPVAVDADAVKAVFRRGVLKLTLPKQEACRRSPRVVPIES